jgi:hypothetical protein
MPAETIQIAPEHAAFMQGGVSINAAACGPDLSPSIARALGCRVAPDFASVRVLVSQAQSAELIAHLRDGSGLAVVFSQPSTHLTLQFKAARAAVEPATETDVAAVARYRAAFIDELRQLGYPPALLRAFMACPDCDLAALVFAPNAVYNQTPGADSGVQIGSAA